jgi:hypothetical protein
MLQCELFSIQNVGKNNAPINVHLTFNLPTTKLNIIIEKKGRKPN